MMKRAILVLLLSLCPVSAHADYWISVAETLEVAGATAVSTYRTFAGRDVRIQTGATGQDTLNQGAVTISAAGGSSASAYGRILYYAALADSFLPDVLDSARWWGYGSTAGTAGLQADTLYGAVVTQGPWTEGTGDALAGEWGVTSYRMMGATWRSFNVVTAIGDSAWGKVGCDSPFVNIAPSGQPLYLQTTEQMSYQGLAGFANSTWDRSFWYRIGAYTSGSNQVRAFNITDIFRWIYYEAPKWGGQNYGFIIRDGREGENGRVSFNTREFDTAGQMWGFRIYGKKRIPHSSPGYRR